MEHESSSGGEVELSCRRARSEEDLCAAATLAAEVYKDRLRLMDDDREVPIYRPEVLVLLVRRRGAPVATMTLQSAAFDRDPAANRPLELEATYDFATLGVPRIQLAEVRRVASTRACPRAYSLLIREAARLSHVAGITRWIGLVEAGSTLDSEAPIVHAAVRAHGLAVAPLPLRPCYPSALYDEALLDVPRAYDNAVMRRIPLPTTIRKFSRVLGARAVSVPTLHPHYRKLVLPMMAQVPASRGAA